MRPRFGLAVTELRDPLTRVRSLAVAATGAIAVFGSVAITGAQHNLEQRAGSHGPRMEPRGGPVGVAARESNTLGTTAFPASVASKLRGLPGVRSVGHLPRQLPRPRRPARVGDRATAQLAAAAPARQLTVGNITQANARLRDHGWAVVSEAIAPELHLHIGDAFTLPSPQPTTFRLAGLSTNGGWPPGAIVINAEDYARAWGSTAASALNIDLDRRRVSRCRAKAEVVHALGPIGALAVQTAGEREHLVEDDQPPRPCSADRNRDARTRRRDPRDGGCDRLDDLAAPRADREH